MHDNTKPITKDELPEGIAQLVHFPARWNDQDKHFNLTSSADGRELAIVESSRIGDHDSTAARADRPIPSTCGVYYFEVEILERGPKGHIAIGFCVSQAPLNRLPGWERGSWGYHADDGWAFSGRKDGVPYGPTFDTGDVIGCGVDFTQHKIFYTKNGSFLGMAFEDVDGDIEIYPTVGLRHQSESIRANFGQEPFKFAINEYALTRRDAVRDVGSSSGTNWNLLYDAGEDGTK